MSKNTPKPSVVLPIVVSLSISLVVAAGIFSYVRLCDKIMQQSAVNDQLSLSLSRLDLGEILLTTKLRNQIDEMKKIADCRTLSGLDETLDCMLVAIEAKK